MALDGYLKVSAIQNESVKAIAQKSNSSTDNDVIDTEEEWKTFLSGIAEGYGAGHLDYDSAKEYTESSSSIFVQDDTVKGAYKQGFLRGLDTINERGIHGSKIARQILNIFNPGANSQYILSLAELTEDVEKRRLLTLDLMEEFKDVDELQ